MTTTQTPAVDLSARYIKVNMKMSGWGNSKNAKEVAAEMEVARGAEMGKALKAGKILLDPLEAPTCTQSAKRLDNPAQGTDYSLGRFKLAVTAYGEVGFVLCRDQSADRRFRSCSGRS